MKIITVSIQKGGSSKTLTCQIMAELLSKEYGKRVLCVDADAQCNLTSLSGVDIIATQHNNIYTMLKGETKPKDCITACKYYDIIPGSMLLCSADSEFVQTGREMLLKEKLRRLKYDICIIDTPPALGIVNIMALTAADHVLIPTECSVLAMIGLQQLNRTINTVRTYTNPKLDISGILVTRYNSRANLNSSIYESLQQIADELKTKVYSTKIRETIKVREAQSQFTPILDYSGASNCTAVTDYRNFMQECGLFT